MLLMLPDFSAPLAVVAATDAGGSASASVESEIAPIVLMTASDEQAAPLNIFFMMNFLNAESRVGRTF